MKQPLGLRLNRTSSLGWHRSFPPPQPHITAKKKRILHPFGLTLGSSKSHRKKRMLHPLGSLWSRPVPAIPAQVDHGLDREDMARLHDAHSLVLPVVGHLRSSLGAKHPNLSGGFKAKQRTQENKTPNPTSNPLKTRPHSKKTPLCLSRELPSTSPPPFSWQFVPRLGRAVEELPHAVATVGGHHRAVVLRRLEKPAKKTQPAPAAPVFGSLWQT